MPPRSAQFTAFAAAPGIPPGLLLGSPVRIQAQRMQPLAKSSAANPTSPGCVSTGPIGFALVTAHLLFGGDVKCRNMPLAVERTIVDSLSIDFS